MSVNLDMCFTQYEALHALPAGILRAIAQVESGMDPTAVSPPNADGTRDYGLMQVNARNLKKFGVPVSVAMEPCTSIALGARILRDGLDATGGDTFAALQMYNTGQPSSPRGEAYALRVYTAWSGGPQVAVLTPATPAGRRAADQVAAAMASALVPRPLDAPRWDM